MAKKKNGNQDAARASERQVSIQFSVPVDDKPLFANHMMVQRDQHNFHLSFFEARPPVLMGSPEEVKKQLDELSEISAAQVARIIIPADRMPAFVAILEKQVPKPSPEENVKTLNGRK